MNLRNLAFIVSAVASLSLVACERAPIPPGSEPAAPANNSAPQKGAIVDAPPALEGESYRLVLRRIEREPSEPEAFALTLEGRGRWKVNEEFPIALTLTADPEIELSADSIDKDGAARFEEEGARFEFEAEGEGGRVNASLRFAMCVPESCTFHTETLGVRLASR